ncbi:MAG: hypothetical protein K2K02_09635 [Ruminococcus sp.]|nr:hypothetical protein [Ruminococcus sp.]MDE6679289.1 hypothetical protein [Ruminococcus sp.]
MKDKEKFAFYCYLVASVSFFISATINFFSKETKYLTVTHICLGTSFLCLASTHKKDKDKN